MYRFPLLLLAPILCLAAGFTAAELQAHRDWMDEAQERKEDVREALAGKDAKKLRTAAYALDQLTEREVAFWARTEVRAAKEIAARNRAEARALLKAAEASRLDAAEGEFDKLEKSCASCHDQKFKP